ncbi:hypothetical protein Q0O35_13940, partial [Staphylococcus aureus]|nr:hypothetical protein [Staphylococcus aureus]
MQENQLGETETTETTWMLYVDGSSTSKFTGGESSWLLQKGLNLSTSSYLSSRRPITRRSMR